MTERPLSERIEELTAAIDAVNEPCEVCGNTADEYGQLEHGRGCYVVNEDGGGTSYVPLEELGQVARTIAPKLIQENAELRKRLEDAAQIIRELQLKLEIYMERP